MKSKGRKVKGNLMEIVLSENQILHLINYGKIETELPNGEVVTIRESYVRDLVEPLINYDKQIVSQTSLKNIAVFNRATF